MTRLIRSAPALIRSTLALAVLAGASTALLGAGTSSALAGCDPKCAKGVTCRYDSTKDPEFWCEASSAKGGKAGLIDGFGKGAVRVQGVNGSFGRDQPLR